MNSKDARRRSGSSCAAHGGRKGASDVCRWNYSFTEEWPAPTDRHQLSITLPALQPGDGDVAAVGDILFNYRLQAIGAGGTGWLAIAPRLSLVLPTGDYRTGAGRGAAGLQLNLPTSIEMGDHLVTHLNAGFTFTPGARSSSSQTETALDANVGLALVSLPVSWLNPLVEIAYLSTEEIRDDRPSARNSMLIVNPGVRTAINFRSGLQIVPGVSAPIQFSERGTKFSVLAYLSFEHPVRNQSGRVARKRRWCRGEGHEPRIGCNSGGATHQRLRLRGQCRRRHHRHTRPDDRWQPQRGQERDV